MTAGTFRRSAGLPACSFLLSGFQKWEKQIPGVLSHPVHFLCYESCRKLYKKWESHAK
jgi:hypothetical protein